jgi:hypothetical protein
MRATSRLAIVITGLITCLLLDSCASGAGAQTAQPRDAMATALRGPYAAGSTDLVIAALANAGIAVQDTETSTVPVTPTAGAEALLRLTRWQARNLALDASAGSGILGETLDTIVGMPVGAPPFSYLLAAWITTADSSSAHLARDLMGDRDWVHAPAVVFPMLVVVLFVSEATQQAAATGTNTTTAQLTSVTTAPCSTVAGFVDSVLSAMFNALKLDPSSFGGGVAGAVGGWFASIWNAAVDLARHALDIIIKQLTAPVINIIRSGIAAVATFTMIASYLKRWHAPIVATPSSTRFAAGAEADVTGTFTVTVDRAGEADSWPPQLIDCAAAVGVPLPQLAAVGAPVDWTIAGADGLLTIASPGPPFAGTLDGNLSAQLTYATGRESAASAATGDPIENTVAISVGVERKELGQLRTLIEGFVLNQVPGVLQPIVNPILAHYIDQALRTIDRIADITAQQTLSVTHHGPARSTPTPSLSLSTPFPSGGTTVAACLLLTAADVSSAMGSGFTVHDSHPVACNYSGTTDSGVVSFGIGACAGMRILEANASAQPVSGVGTQAWFGASTLFVCSGDRGFYLLMDTVSTTLSADRGLGIAVSLAQKVVAKL